MATRERSQPGDPSHLNHMGMGKPTWLLLPCAVDWRQLEDREDSPWFPTMRFFRQSVWGDWQEVMERVTRELVRLLRRENGRWKAPA